MRNEGIQRQVTGLILRFAASGWIPAGWFGPGIPAEEDRTARTGRLKIEIVSHCWNYAHFLIYQLSSLVQHPPEKTDVTVTVFHAAEDRTTRDLLSYISSFQLPSITWNFRLLPKEQLFRRAIGRNRAALETPADWIWFTDCDVLFGKGCLDSLAEALQGRREALVFPKVEYITELLSEQSPILHHGKGEPQIIPLDTAQFHPHFLTRATGPFQITHGDVARQTGYCRHLAYYQTPAPVWCKAYEDRAFRWILGTQGTPLDVSGVSRIRHINKGRYTDANRYSALRRLIRRTFQKRW